MKTKALVKTELCNVLNDQAKQKRGDAESTMISRLGFIIEVAFALYLYCIKTAFVSVFVFVSMLRAQ